LLLDILLVLGRLQPS